MSDVKLPWYVLTGGPCSGKTSLLEELGRRGFGIVPEAARTLIDERLKRGMRLEQIRVDETAFQEEALRFKIELERKTPRTVVYFFDRGIPDTVAYLRAHDLPVSEAARLASASARYAKVFLLDLLPFIKDYARTETPEEAARIEKEIEHTYREYGHEIVRVPVMPIGERADFVLAHVDHVASL